MPSNQQDDERRITYFAATHTRSKHDMFGIRAIDRGKHMYIIGKTGMGKSTMLENMAIQDIQNGEGICFIDPHGSTAEKLLDFVPYERINDVVYLAPFDTDHPVGFNVMEDVGFDKRHLVVSGLMGALKRIWVDAWSARMEYILQNTLLALLEYPDSTLLDVNRMLTNKPFRAAVVERITDPIVKAFWTEEFAAFTDSYTREATPAIQNKVGQFTSNPLIRNIVGQAKSSFDLRKIMDERKIFIVNLSKGRMGETNASLLGSMLTVKIYLAAMSRADEPAAVMARLPRCYFYVDEFQSMMNEAFADILSESRKYKLALTLANQYVEQMEEKVRDAVFGNVGTLVCFRIGSFDAEVLKVEFEPTFTAEDLVALGVGEVYLKLMIDGVGSQPFSAQTIPPIETPRISYRDDVVSHSRAIFGRPRADVENVINQKQLDFAPPAKKEKRPGEGNQSQGAAPRDGARSFPPRPSPSSGGQNNFRPATPPSAALSNPSRTERPAWHEQRPESRPPVEEKNALRAAIESARTTSVVLEERPQTPAQPIRSPADILRERSAGRQSSPPPTKDNPQPRPEMPRQSQTRPHNENNEGVDRRAEVAHEVLSRVLNGEHDV
jgi:energy-coupling factor transporter ATP-binding protein EcfA2